MSVHPWIIMDGELLQSEFISVSPGGALWRGRGWFETLAVKDNRVYHVPPHLKRMRESLPATLRDQPSWGRLHTQLDHLAERGPSGPARIKLVCWEEQARLRTAGWIRPYTPPGPETYRRGIELSVQRSSHPPRDPLSHQKRLGYDEVLTNRERAGTWDVLYCDLDGNVWETGIANLFWFDERTLCTPPFDGQVLPGTIAMATLETAHESGIDVRRVHRPHEEITGACWVTNSMVGMLPVRAIQGRETGSCRQHHGWKQLRQDLHSAKVFPIWDEAS